MKLVVLDGGHGGHDSGAKGYGMQEKDLTLKIVHYTRDFLKPYDVKVILTREVDKYLTLQERCNIANKNKADLFISIHINAGGGTGFESFIHNVVPEQTIERQNIIHNEIYKKVYGRNRGQKRNNFYVLGNTNMDAILTECGFIDNNDDAYLLKSDGYLKRIALGHANGIVKALNLKKK